MQLHSQVNDLIQFADIDGDGVIDYLEFVSLMMNLNFDERNAQSAPQHQSRPSTPGSETSSGSRRPNGVGSSPPEMREKKKQPAMQRR